MATRTALLNWNVINRDADFSKHIEAVSEPWVLSWLTVTSSSVAVWEAFVKCERTNGDVIYALVYNTEAQSISWNGDVYIEVSQEIIDNGELGREDWTEISEIKVWTMPAKNALKLATISSGTVTDKRNMIKKTGELKTLIDTNTADIVDLDERVESLEAAWAIDHLEESSLVWELYTMSDTLLKQKTPILSDCIIDCNVSNTNGNAEIHIQRIWSWIASNQLKLKVKMVWSTTQDLNVEVRKWVAVTVTANEEAYWYWDEVVASWSIDYSDITSSYAEITVTLDNDFWGTKGELLDVVVYMDVVNASNYYCIACDEKQCSEWFSYVAVNGNTRTRTKVMPYCTGDWLNSDMLVKYVNKADHTEADLSRTVLSIAANAIKWGSPSNTKTYTWLATASWTFSFVFDANGSTNWRFQLHVNWTRVVYDSFSPWYPETYTFSCYKWDIVVFGITGVNSDYVVSNKAFDVNQTKAYLYAPVNGLVLQPRTVEDLWELAMWTVYWRHPNDWVFYGGIMMDKDTVALAWEITPWNFVWYIRVNFNWEVIKIPYYS